MTPAAGPTAAAAPRRRRRLPVVLLAVGVLMLTGLAAAFIGHSQGWGKGSEDTAPGPTDTSAAPPDAAGQKPDPAPSPDGQAPDWGGLDWMDVHGAQLPVSPVHGPREATVPMASGFSRDTGGAVLAAVHLATRVSPQVGPDVYVPNAERMHGSTGEVSGFLAQLDADHAAARAASGLPEGEPLRIHAQVVGYAVPAPVGSSPTEATVHLLSRGAGPDGGEVLVSVPVTLVWEGGDWRLQVPPGGRWPGEPVSGTGGYTLFDDADAGGAG